MHLTGSLIVCLRDEILLYNATDFTKKEKGEELTSALIAKVVVE